MPPTHGESDALDNAVQDGIPISIVAFFFALVGGVYSLGRRRACRSPLDVQAQSEAHGDGAESTLGSPHTEHHRMLPKPASELDSGEVKPEADGVARSELGSGWDGHKAALPH